MKFKKQIFALGAVAIIAAPIATVVSCGSTNNNNHNNNKENGIPIVRVMHFANRPVAGSYKITISPSIVTYSKAAPIKGDTYTFTNVTSKVKTVYTVTATPSATAKSMTVSVMVGNIKGADISTVGLIAASTSDLVLSDPSGSYYITGTEAISSSSPIITWLNYNTNILKGTTDPAAALKRINIALSGTYFYGQTIAIATTGKITALGIATKIPTAVATKTTGFSMNIDGHALYSTIKPVFTNVWTFHSFNGGTVVTTTYKITTVSTGTGDKNLVTFSKAVDGGTEKKLPPVIYRSTDANGIVLNGFDGNSTIGGIYIANPVTDSSMITNWLNTNNIISRTANENEAATEITKIIGANASGFTCSNVTFAKDGAIKAVIITKA